MALGDFKTKQLAANNAGSQGGYIDLTMWVGDPSDPSKGTLIDNEMIDAFTITENMFTLLPTMVFQLITRGKFYYSNNIKIGDMVNVILTPKSMNDDEYDPEPYIKASFVVQTIANEPQPFKDVYLNKYICIFPAQRYLSEVSAYPTMDLKTALLYQKTTSAEALNTVLSECGLTLQNDTDEGEINDASYWLNCSETRAEFAKRIIDHAWCGRGNAPLLYSTASGAVHYQTIRDICKSEKDKGVIDNKYIFLQNFNGQETDNNSKNNTVLISALHSMNAAGPILNLGGYSLSYSIYNPYNKEKIAYKQNSVSNMNSESDEAIPKFSDTNALSTINDTEEKDFGYRNVHIKFDEDLLATIPNRQPSEKDVVTINTNGGVHFDELHPYYDLAPKHNEQVRRNFFQQFTKVTVDANRQLDCFRNASVRPKLGETIYLDASKSGDPDVIYTGRYCIVEIKYMFGYKKPYTLELTVANDGYYGDKHE